MKIDRRTKEMVLDIINEVGASEAAHQLGVHFTAVHRWANGGGITTANVAAIHALHKRLAPPEDDAPITEEVAEQDPVQIVLDLVVSHPDRMKLITEGLKIVGVRFEEES